MHASQQIVESSTFIINCAEDVAKNCNSYYKRRPVALAAPPKGRGNWDTDLARKNCEGDATEINDTVYGCLTLSTAVA